jgi:hypothetical protein
MAVERAGADLRALRNFVHAGVGAAARKNLPGNVYVQVVEENVMRAINSHATTVLEGWTPAVERMGLMGRNVKRLPQPSQTLEAV